MKLRSGTDTFILKSYSKPKPNIKKCNVDTGGDTHGGRVDKRSYVMMIKQNIAINPYARRQFLKSYSTDNTPKIKYGTKTTNRCKKAFRMNTPVD